MFSNGEVYEISLNEIIGSVNPLKEVIKVKYRAKVVGIFGSFVRGEKTI